LSSGSGASSGGSGGSYLRERLVYLGIHNVNEEMLNAMIEDIRNGILSGKKTTYWTYVKGLAIKNYATNWCKEPGCVIKAIVTNAIWKNIAYGILYTVDPSLDVSGFSLEDRRMEKGGASAILGNYAVIVKVNKEGEGMEIKQILPEEKPWRPLEPGEEW